jgi:hypothetical protein
VGWHARTEHPATLMIFDLLGLSQWGRWSCRANFADVCLANRATLESLAYWVVNPRSRKDGGAP